jgi:dTDP-4-dehydrorhamnose reductase
MSSILIIGGTGLLGSTLGPILLSAGHEVIIHGYQSSAMEIADITDRMQAIDLVKKYQPDILINLVALTDVDKCEKFPDLAYRLNLLTVQNLLLAKRIHNYFFVQISTDMVYDGAGPHKECNVTVKNTYALSKLAAEIAVTSAGGLVLRTNFFGRSTRLDRRSFTDWIFASLIKQEHIRVINDVLFSPLSMKTLSKEITLIIEKRLTGLYNLGSRDGMSKAEFAYAFASALGQSAKSMEATSINKIPNLLAVRSIDMRMNVASIEEALERSMPKLIDEIKQAAEEYND